MGNFATGVKEKEKREERDKVRREKLASFFYDSAKLFLGGIVIGNIIQLTSSSFDNYKIFAIILGVFATWAFAYIANNILKK